MGRKEHKSFYWIFAIWLLVVLSFVLKHLNNDFLVFWGYGKQVKMTYSHGPNALLDVWDIKGMLFRFYAYVEYLITSAVCGDVFTLQAQAVYKLTGILLFLSVLGISVKQIPEKFMPVYLSRKTCFMVISVMLLACHNINHLQTEMIGVFMLLLATSLSLSSGTYMKLLAGVLIGLLFFLKTPMILMAGSLFFTYMLLTHQSLLYAFKNLAPLIAAACLTLAGGLLFLYVFFYQELLDIYDASHYEHTLLETPGLIYVYLSGRKFLSYLAINSIRIPLLGIAQLCFLYEIVWGIHNRHYRTALLYMFMLGFPIAFIMLSNCFLPYHYYLLAYPSIVIVLYSGRRWHGNKVLCRLMGSVSAICLIVYLWFLSALSPYNIKASLEYQESALKNAREMQELLSNHPSSKVLYLDSGFGACFLSVPSYLRYIYPLPIQRFNERFSEYAYSDRFKTVKQQILLYDDNIIVCDWAWFFSMEHPDIRMKIEKEYQLTGKFYFREFTNGVIEGSLLVEELIFTKRATAE